MAKARFFTTDTVESFELERIGSNSDGIEIKARLKWWRLTLRSRKFTATRAELESLANWVDDFWDEVPPAELGKGMVRFVYSHRQSIGDGYFNIEMDGKRVLHVYEQLGQSNTFRAKEIRSLLE